MLKLSHLTIVSLLASAAALAANALPADRVVSVVVRDVAVLDSLSSRWLTHRDIVISDTTITSVLPTGAALPAAKTQIDGAGKFAVPGLFDDQVALARFTRDTAGLFIVNGITSVRDVGTSGDRIAEWRREIAYGRFMGPRIVATCGDCATVRPDRDARARHDELVRLVRESGVTPAAALRRATIEAAESLGRAQDLGSIEVGKIADLLVLTGDPLADIRHTASIDAVIFRGEALTRAHLNLLISRAAGRSGKQPR